MRRYQQDHFRDILGTDEHPSQSLRSHLNKQALWESRPSAEEIKFPVISHKSGKRMAPDKDEAQKHIYDFIKIYGIKCPKAAECLRKDHKGVATVL